jgi:hypothetical protein
MMRAFFIFFLMVSVSAAAQNPPAALPPQSTEGPFDAKLIQYRVWTNNFFGISWTIPKGLFSREEQEAQWQHLMGRNPQGVTQIVQGFHKRDEEDRRHGILLRGDDHDPGSAGRVANSQADASGIFRAPNSGSWSIADRTFMVLARPLQNPSLPISELLQAETAKISAEDSAAKVTLSTEPETFGGIQFVHADWKRRDKVNDRDMHYRSYVASSNGYELAFTFSADSAKGLEGICKSMASISPAAQSAQPK